MTEKYKQAKKKVAQLLRNLAYKLDPPDFSWFKPTNQSHLSVVEDNGTLTPWCRTEEEEEYFDF